MPPRIAPPKRFASHPANHSRSRTRRKLQPLAETLEARTLLATDAITNALGHGKSIVSFLDPTQLEALKLKKTPKPAITASVVSGPDANGVVTVAGKTYAKAKVKLDIGATGKVEQTVKANKHGLFQFTFPVRFGSTRIRLSATAAGHKPTSTILTVNRLDLVPPIIAVEGPSPGPLARTEVTFTGDVTDIGTGVASLDAVVDGGADVPISFSATGSFSYTTTLALDGSADGGHQVQFVAVDRAGNVGRSAVESFTLDTRAPTLTITSPAQGSTTATNVTVTGRAADALSGIAALQAQVDGGAAVAVAVGPSGNFSYTTTLKLDGSADGSHQVQFVAVDGAGNIGQSAVESFTLDTRVPTLTITSPAQGSTTATNVTVTGRAADALSGIAALHAQVDGGAAVAVAVGPSGNFSYTTTLKLDGSANGPHTVMLTATNGVGTSSAASVSFTLNASTVPSTISLLVTAPVDSSDLSATGRLIGTVTETGTAMPSAQFSLDGGALASLPLDSDGHFDMALSTTPLALGSHQVMVEAMDTSGNMSKQTINFTVSSDFLIGAAGTSGWGEATTGDIHLEERSSLLVQYSVPVTLGAVVQGARTISFSVSPQFDQTDTTSVGSDQLLVSLVDPSNPSQALLSGSQPGTPLFALGKEGAAELAPGLVSFDGTTVTIDVTSLTTVSSGLLVFQMVNTDADDGTVVDIRGLSDTVNPDGTPDSAISPPAIATSGAGAAVDFSTLSAASGVSAQLSNVSLDAATGLYSADLQVMNAGAPLGRNVVVDFTGLPSGVTMLGASGTDSGGNPYLNMHDAIAPGGLGTGAMSELVPISFSDPSLVRFGLTPTILDGGPELPPTLAPIAPVTVMPGQVVNVPLRASDPNGDPITFTIQSNGPLPTSTLEPNGTLVINPAPSDIGTYNFNIVASDGSRQATQPVTLTVSPDPNSDTRVSGFVLATTGAPLPGETITLDGLTATTGSDGSFLLDFGNNPPPSSDRLSVGSIVLDGQKYASVAEVMSLLLGHDVYTGVNNVISRPIYLPTIDLAGVAMVVPGQNTTVTPDEIPGGSLFVAANTLLEPNGQPYSGPLSVSPVPVDQTPAALPADLKPTLVVTIQPSGMTFTTPAPITLPNPGYAPGTIMNLWSISPVTGEFAIAGQGQVSADGTVINTISGGVHLSSWHFFAPPPPPDPSPPPAPPPPCTVTAASQVDLLSGDVEETANLVGYQSLGTENSLQLSYDSERADPEPIVRVGYDNLDTSSFNTFPTLVLMASLTVQEGSFTYTAPGYTGTGIAGLSGGEQFWDVPTDGGAAYANFQVDMTSEPTGVYDYTMLTGFFGIGPTHSAVAGSSATTNGQIYLVNDIDSPFGSGWDLAGLETIVPQPDGSVMLVDGGGQINVFQPPTTAGGAFISQAGDFSTLVQLPDGTFQRTMTDQTVYHFNADNQLATITDRNGNVTTYGYDSNGQLATITDPVGLVTHFTYTGSHITAIIDPTGKTTQLAYDAAGNLVMITNPDGSHTEYQYDAEHHLIGDTDPLGNQGHDIYDAFGRAEMSIQKNGAVVTFNPVEVQGLQPPGGPFDPFNAPLAGTETAEYVDGDGHVSDTTFNYAGYMVGASDGEGSIDSTQLDSNFQVTTSTDGDGYSTINTYDADGNLTSSQSGFSGQISGEIVNPGDQDIYTFKATQGQRFFYEGLGTYSNNIYTKLTGPSGETVFNINAATDSGTYVLPEAGTYQLILAGSGGATGTYEFQVLNPTETVSPLTNGTAMNGTIANPGDDAVYTFTGTVGERIFYSPAVTGYIGRSDVKLFDPYGNQVFDVDWDQTSGPLDLDFAGTYRLVFSRTGNATGSYSFSLLNPAYATTPLTVGTPVTGTLANPGDQAAYTFTAAAGERIFYSPATVGYLGSSDVRLFDPFGNQVFDVDWDQTDGPFDLGGGTYRLIFSRTGNATGSYSFSLLNPVYPTTPLTVGTPVTGTLANPGDQAAYTFTAAAGERIFYSPATIGYLGSSDVRLFDPFGNQVFDVDWDQTDGPFDLGGGTYRLIFSRTGNATGSYSFSLLNPVYPTTPLTVGTPVTGTLANPGDQAAYTFTAAAGERIFYSPATVGYLGRLRRSAVRPVRQPGLRHRLGPDRRPLRPGRRHLPPGLLAYGQRHG